jgi:hypothetical protein
MVSWYRNKQLSIFSDAGADKSLYCTVISGLQYNISRYVAAGHWLLQTGACYYFRSWLPPIASLPTNHKANLHLGLEIDLRLGQQATSDLRLHKDQDIPIFGLLDLLIIAPDSSGTVTSLFSFMSILGGLILGMILGISWYRSHDPTSTVPHLYIQGQS